MTNHIPLGIKALVAGIKLKEKMEYYFPKDSWNMRIISE